MQSQCEWEVLGNASKFKYLRFVVAESGTSRTECWGNWVSGKKIAGVMRPLVNGRGFRLEYAWVLNEALLVTVLIYRSETEC